jgi:hypothetical protein
MDLLLQLRLKCFQFQLRAPSYSRVPIRFIRMRKQNTGCKTAAIEGYSVLFKVIRNQEGAMLRHINICGCTLSRAY